ncbi:response regulator transcription factor, partial [Nocardioides hankookensis]
MYAVIIEDDPDTARLLSVLLRQAGFEPIVATDGPDGLEAVRAHRPAVTTVDRGLPGPDGWSVIRQIREFSSTYVVVVSGSASESDLLDGFAAGADDYVTKPFRIGELRSRVLAGLRLPAERVSMAFPGIGEDTERPLWIEYA